MDMKESLCHYEEPFSILDNDLYKFNMQFAILKHFSSVEVEYSFTNRTSDKHFNREATVWLQEQIDRLEDLRLTEAELQYLQEHCGYLSNEYLQYLRSLRLRPKEQVVMTCRARQEDGLIDIDLRIRGLWIDTILYEIPLLALISEAYFKFVDIDWNHDGQEQLAYEKGMRLFQAGCVVSEFGSRRRRDHRTQDLVIKGLKRAEQDNPNATGKLSGTSNVYFAMKHGIDAIGTVAHEWYMGIAAITDDYERANELGLHYWLDCFGEGVLGIALTDTFGTSNFFEAFRKPVSGTKDILDGRKCSQYEDLAPCYRLRTYAEVFSGIRQDSGDPKNYIQQAGAFYRSMGLKNKSIIFSDSLNVEKCIEYRATAAALGLLSTFGVGTFFTNDFCLRSNRLQKSKPLNIVIKISKAAGRPCVKLSDDLNKNTGDTATIKEVKLRLGYEESHVNELEESNRL